MEETFEELTETIESEQSKFYGVVTGTVVNLLDPMGLGRVQVEVPSMCTEISAWARVAAPMAGMAHGIYFIPNLGDEVLVAFENGNVQAPYVMGSIWHATSPPPLPSPLAQIRMIRTPLGHEIALADLLGTITIKTATNQTILMSAAGIQLIAGTNIVALSDAGISISTAADLTLTAGKSITINSPKVSINGTASAELNSLGVCQVTGKPVKIN